VLPIWADGHAPGQRATDWPSKDKPEVKGVQFGTGYEPVQLSIVKNPAYDLTKKHLYEIIWTEDSVTYYVDSRFVIKYTKESADAAWVKGPININLAIVSNETSHSWGF
jgi:beta-glucanase (GH16 family)